ncbi:MAG TPA: transglycosylase SLT domain-containing protein [Candidatus Binatia bacterium]
MWAIKVAFALSLGVTGIIGCASSERLYDRTTTSTIPIPQTSSPAANLADSASGATSLESSANDTQQPAIRAPNPLAQTREAPPTAQFKPIEPQPERVTSEGKTAQPIKLSPPSAQAAPSLGADNRLLELLDKDFEKAVEQFKERRRLQFSKEVVEHARVRHFVKYYSTTGKIRFQELLARSGKYMPMIAKVLSQEGLPEELGYLALLESEFVVTTTSRNGAVGLWQFVATTARQYGLRIDEWVDERRDPVKSTRAATRYLKDLHDYYGRWYLATAAYNAGPGNVDRALQQSGAKDFWNIKAKAQLSEETRNFVPKFVAISLIATDPKKYGLDDVRYVPPLDYEEVELKTPIKLATLAQTAETDIADIRNLNPALLRDVTPPGEADFHVNLPVGKASVLLAKSNEKTSEKDAQAAQLVTHEVKRGETLFSIARFYGLEVRALMEFNGLTTPRLRIGQKLRIFLDGLRGALR